ncbi:MAG: zinc metallopeptidase [Clostridia bacterium]|nr:zinc metallopeptidase [Clostridia bacterium]
MFMDPWYLLLLVVFALSIFASNRVESTFKKYGKEPAQSGVCGAELANALLEAHGEPIPVHPVSGTLTDHFDPVNNTVGLSQTVYNNSSVSALAVTAHEIGHVLQHQQGYAAIRLRNAVLPVASFSSSFAPLIIIAGLVLGLTNIAWAGVVLFGAVLAFQVVTLPVEFDASARGLRMLEEGGYVSREQIPHAKEVLRAAAMTYVLAALASLVNLLRFASMVNSRSRD